MLEHAMDPFQQAYVYRHGNRHNFFKVCVYGCEGGVPLPSQVSILMLCIALYAGHAIFFNVACENH